MAIHQGEDAILAITTTTLTNMMVMTMMKESVVTRRRVPGERQGRGGVDEREEHGKGREGILFRPAARGSEDASRAIERLVVC